MMSECASNTPCRARNGDQSDLPSFGVIIAREIVPVRVRVRVTRSHFALRSHMNILILIKNLQCYSLAVLKAKRRAGAEHPYVLEEVEEGGQRA